MECVIIYIMSKKNKIDKETTRNMASDILTDAIYSFTTDLLKELYEDGNLQDLERAIATVNNVTKSISRNGIKLRKANIERRTASRKDVENVEINKDDVEWTRYSKDKKLEYTTDIVVNGKYIIKKRKQDIVVGLLMEDDEIKYKLSSKEKEKIFGMGFVLDL